MVLTIAGSLLVGYQIADNDVRTQLAQQQIT
jgi:hypothetical protein